MEAVPVEVVTKVTKEPVGDRGTNAFRAGSMLSHLFGCAARISGILLRLLNFYFDMIYDTECNEGKGHVHRQITKTRLTNLSYYYNGNKRFPFSLSLQIGMLVILKNPASVRISMLRQGI